MTARARSWVAYLRQNPEVGPLALGVALLAGLLWLVRTQAPHASVAASAPAREPLARAQADSATSPGEKPKLLVSRAAIDHLRTALARESGAHLSTAAEERALVERAIDEEVLYREALALKAESGHQDPVIVQRAQALARELDAGRTGEGRELSDAARDLGLAQSDLVIRRYLVEAMRLALMRAPRAGLPNDAELRAYYDRHRASYARPARLALTQVYFADDRRGGRARALDDAASLREQLRTGTTRPDDAPRLGDPFPRGAELEGTPAQLDRIFGAGFAQASDAAPAQSWTAPIESAYGAHLVWVRERTGARTPSFEEVRTRVLNAWLEEAGDRRLREKLDALRARYRIEVAPADPVSS